MLSKRSDLSAEKTVRRAKTMADAQADLAAMRADALTGRVVSLPPCTVGLAGNADRRYR